MTTKQIVIITTVADCGSFARAGERLFLSRQAIMKQVNQLEAELGFAVFDRNAQGAVLTKGGERFLAGIKPVREQLRQLIESCRQDEMRGERLRIEIPRHPSSLLDEVLKCFSLRYPDITVDIVRCPSQGRIRRLTSGKIDVAEMPYIDELKRDELEYVRLVNNRYMCLMSPTHPLARQDEVEPKQLTGYPLFVAKKKRRQELLEYLRTYAAELSFKEVPGDELDGLLNVCYNNGIFITPAYYAAHLDVVTALPLRPEITKEIGLAWRRDAAPCVRDFVAVAKEIYPG